MPMHAAPPRMSPSRAALERVLDAIERWLLAEDPDQHSPSLFRRAVHWFRTCCRFALVCACAFTIEYAIVWYIATELGLIHLRLTDA